MCFWVTLPKGEYDVTKYIGAEPYDRKKYGGPDDPKNNIIRLDKDVKYICEVQLNLKRMVEAKHNAHKFYEGPAFSLSRVLCHSFDSVCDQFDEPLPSFYMHTQKHTHTHARTHMRAHVTHTSRLHFFFIVIRSKLPKLCQGLSADPEQANAYQEKIKAYVAERLNHSSLEGIIAELEEQTDGLMMYAKLLSDHLQRLSDEAVSCTRLHYNEHMHAVRMPGQWRQIQTKLRALVVYTMVYSKEICHAQSFWLMEGDGLIADSSFKPNSCIFVCTCRVRMRQMGKRS